MCPLELWMWIIIHVHCSRMNSGTAGRWRRSKGMGKSTDAGEAYLEQEVATAMKKSGRWFRRRCCNEWWPALVTAGRRNVLQRRERRSWWLITNAVVAGRWSWQRVVVLVAQGGARGRNVDGVGFLWWMKKEEEAEEENLLGGEGGPRSGCPYRRWGFGIVERLSSRLLVEEKGFHGVFNGWRRGGERKREEMCRNWKKTSFLANFRPDFLLLQAMKSISIYRRWKRAILSTLG